MLEKLALCKASMEAGTKATEVWRQFGFSSLGHLRYQFHKHYNSFPRDVVRSPLSQKIEQAEKLLLETSDSIGSIAKAVGYDAKQSFARAFQKVHGMSARQWRTINKLEG